MRFSRRIVPLLTVLFWLTLPVYSQTIRWADLQIVSPDGTYLGNCNPSTYDSKSIFNTYGDHGSKYGSESIYSTYGTYGSAYSQYSAFCKTASDPPLLVYDGRAVARLTTNKSIANAIEPAVLVGMIHANPQGYFRSSSVGASRPTYASPARASSGSADERIINLARRAGKVRLTGSSLGGYSAKHLTIARNAIYALHGRQFTDAELRSFFLRQGWYRPNPNYHDGMLSELERTNAKFIMRYQKETGREW